MSFARYTENIHLLLKMFFLQNLVN